MRTTVWLLFLPLMIGCADQRYSSQSATARAAERLPLEVCQIDGITEPLLCGKLMVFENRAAASGRKIPISVVVIPAKTPSDTTTAWIEHQGGPRFSMIANAGDLAEGGYLEWFRETRDVVLIDPRGLHESHPLYCDALSYPRLLERYYSSDRVSACREEVDAIADVRQYSTLNAIADYEDIRKWLGYERWDVGGWSFGGRFMLTYIHLYPESIRSAILSFPADLQFLRPLNYARFGQMGFDNLIQDCAEDPACHAAFPNPAGDLKTVLDKLDDEPVTVQFRDPDTGEIASREVTRDIFADEFWTWLLENKNARQIPFVLRRAAQNDFEPFLELAIPKSPQSREPEGHYFSVVCPEETLHLPQNLARKHNENTFYKDYTLDEYTEACLAWGLPPAPEFPLEPKSFSVPLLVFTGDLDPVAQPEQGAEIAALSEDGLHVNLPGIAHGLDGVKNAGCYDKIFEDFLQNQSTKGLDTSCVDTMLPPPFRLE